MKVAAKEAPANSVTAAAVIGRVRGLMGINGGKEIVGGMTSEG